MTGINTWSTTASENVNSNIGFTLDEGMAPASVNNSMRSVLTDLRNAFNDLMWFQYGIGSKSVAATYASGTSFTLAGADATTAWHAGRRVKAVGSSTGTIYGKVSSSSFSVSTTTVNVTWDSGSLSNESLTVYLSQTPITGRPISQKSVAGDSYTFSALPTGISAGTRTFISDASAAFTSSTLGTTAAGSGANFAPVYWDGSNWRYG